MRLIKTTTTIAAFLALLLLAEMALIKKGLFIPFPVEEKPSELRTWNSWGQSPPRHRSRCHKKPWSSGCLPWRKKKPPPPAPRHVVIRPPRPPRPPRRVHWWEPPPPPA
ncbi:UNVERIFIED_CONTAM: hypothetical protein Sindi_1601600 [Sesamum indicum]